MLVEATKKTAFYAFVTAIVIYSVFPFYYAIITSFKTGTAIFEVTYLPTSFGLDNYKAVFSSGGKTMTWNDLLTLNILGFPLNLLNSVIVSAAVVALSLLIAVTAAFALSRVKFRGRGLLLMTILSVSMFPQVAVLAGLFELIRALHIYNTVWALIFSYTIFTLPFTVWVLTTFMRDLPIEIEEAAIVDGASPWVIITKVFMPLLWPALVTTGLLAFIAAWNEFLYALTFTLDNAHRTVPVAISQLTGASDHEIPWGPIMAASVVVTVPLIVLVLIFQRKIIAGLTAGGVKG
jgi:trehalose/maltose transport system permease protein